MFIFICFIFRNNELENSLEIVDKDKFLMENKDVNEKNEPNVLKNIKAKSNDHVTIGFYGKGAKGYAIKEMILRRGLGRKRVSKMFENYLHLKDKNPQCLPQTVLRLKEYGPRVATLGYRF